MNAREHKKKKRKKTDSGFNPKTYQFGEKRRRIKKTNFEFNPNPRANHKNELPDGSALKTSAILDFKLLTTPKPIADGAKDEISQAFAQKLTRIKTHRAPTNVEYSKEGSPVKVYTPEKQTQLSRVAKLGDTSIFSNDPALIPYDLQVVVTGINHDDDFFNSSEYQAVCEALTAYKFQEITITAAQRKAILQQKDLTNPRGISQNKAAAKPGISEKKGSATNYTRATKLFPSTIKMEWAHLKAHFVAGKLSQHIDNLVASFVNSNINMRFTEAETAFLDKKYPQGIHCRYWADLVTSETPQKSTQIGTVITSTIETNDFTLPIPISAQDPNLPHAVNGQYFHAALESYLEVLPKQTDSLNEKSVVKRNLFPEIVAPDEATKQKSVTLPTAIKNSLHRQHMFFKNKENHNANTMPSIAPSMNNLKK